MANQTMGRFAIKTGKMLFAVDDGAGAFSGGKTQN
jgi:hypothetical protein